MPLLMRMGKDVFGVKFLDSGFVYPTIKHRP